MIYRLAQESDIDAVCKLVKAAVCSMEKHGIYQWDDIYPAKEDFLDDIWKQQLHVGIVDDDAAVVYTVNKDCEKEYENGR